jgi:hypothetical protein
MPCGPGGGAVTPPSAAPVVAIPPCPPPKVEPVPKELEVEIAKLGKIRIKGFPMGLTIALGVAFVVLLASGLLAVSKESPTAIPIALWLLALLALLTTVFILGRWIGENRAARQLQSSTIALELEITRRVQVQVVAAENETLRRQLVAAMAVQPPTVVDSTSPRLVWGILTLLASFEILLFSYLLLTRREQLRRERHNEWMIENSRDEQRREREWHEQRWREQQWRDELRREKERDQQSRPQQPTTSPKTDSTDS